VLEHTSMPLLLDVLEIFPGRAARRILLAHIAETPSELGELFTIGAFAEPVDAKVVGLDERGTREKS
jgi:hypothetical protein